MQEKNARGGAEARRRESRIDRGYLPEVIVGQVFLYFLAGLFLDGGMVGNIVLTAIIIHWIVVGVIEEHILISKNRRLTTTDIILIRFGYLIFLGLFAMIVAVLTKWK